MRGLIQFLYSIIVLAYSIYSFFILDLNNTQIYMLDYLLIANLLLVSLVIIFSVMHGIKEHFTLFAFTCSFAVFNLGAYLFNMGSADYGIHVFHQINYISNYNVARTLIITYVTVLTYFIFYMIPYYKNKKCKITSTKNINSSVMTSTIKVNINKIRFITRVIMNFGMLFAFIKLANEILFVFRNGYNAYYLTLSYNNPIVDLFDGLYTIGFFGFLATMPSKKEIKRPVFIFVVYSFATLFMGKRGVMITGILTVIWYFMKWDTSKLFNKKIITQKRMIYLTFLAVVLLGFMYQFQSIRVNSWNRSSADLGVFSSFFGIIESLGFSGKTLSLAFQYEKELHMFNSFNILFNPIIRYISNNSVVRVFGGGYSTLQSLDALYKVGAFSGMLTYVTNPVAFFNGGGVGSNYLGELYVSYGIVSVLLFNMVLGYILYRMDNIATSKWQVRFIMIYAFNIFMFLPRSQAFEIIPNLVLPIIISSFIMYIGLDGAVSKKLKDDIS